MFSNLAVIVHESDLLDILHEFISRCDESFLKNVQYCGQTKLPFLVETIFVSLESLAYFSLINQWIVCHVQECQ